MEWTCLNTTILEVEVGIDEESGIFGSAGMKSSHS